MGRKHSLAIIFFLILLLLAIPVSALFGRIILYTAPNVAYYHICFKLDGQTYNFKIDRTTPEGWTCGDIEINDTSIRLKCGSSKYGSAFQSIFNGCDGGKACRSYEFYNNWYGAIYSYLTDPFSWNLVGPPSNPVGYPLSRYISDGWQVSNLPIYSDQIEINSGSCPAAIISSNSPQNVSIIRKKDITINITTDINATCKYSNITGLAFSDMTYFTNTNSTSHTFNFNATDVANYSFNFKCVDEFGDVNDDYLLTLFSELSTPSIDLNESLPSNITTNSTLSLFANFSDSGSGFTSNTSCEICLASDGICDTEWSSTNVSTNYQSNYLSGNCSYLWNTLNYIDSVYNFSFRIGDTADNIGLSSKKIILDRGAPTFGSGWYYPYDNGAISVYINNTNQSIIPFKFTFSYYTDDLSSISNCSLILNNKLNATDLFISKNSVQNFRLNLSTAISGSQYYNWSLSCSDVFGHEGTTDIRTFTLIVVGNFSGTTTDLATVNISHIENLTFEEPSSGKIIFTDIVNLSGVSNINDYVKIYYNRVEVNSSILPALNKSATLYMYNLTYNYTPRVLRDNLTCPETICKVINYSNGTLIFNVTQFSVYTTEDAPASSGDSGSSGGSDSGGTSGGGGGGGSGGGGGGGGGLTFVCNMDWQCDGWSDCINGVQTRECNFVKVPQHAQDTACPDSSKSPATTQTCEVKVENKEITPTKTTEAQKLASNTENMPQSNINQTTERKGLFASITGAATKIASNSKAMLEVKTAALAIIGVLIVLSIFFYYKSKLRT